ncbi:AT-rich interactive domain-containing protein 1B isoform X3 [Lingula anatina]|uniref:AT-rich interactive domain-containing protein 1B isoform X3 n=1 Tax=Lingula anatina TaxID=7574 RepID=A0A1S3HEK9_LINAN|nr:AT-rich interactive domain-containing protein 1B isoform X3 [Lingula anatina]|eukprot:XP_013384498.1 AT-rich interactive domain-containing protein 1B isoform X3 [Lingula anatina]
MDSVSIEDGPAPMMMNNKLRSPQQNNDSNNSTMDSFQDGGQQNMTDNTNDFPSNLEAPHMNADSNSFPQSGGDAGGGPQYFNMKPDGLNPGQMHGYNNSYNNRGHMEQHGGNGEFSPQTNQYGQYGQQMRSGYPPGMRGPVPVQGRPMSNMNQGPPQYGAGPQRFPSMSGQSISQQAGPTPTLNQLLQSNSPANQQQTPQQRYQNNFNGGMGEMVPGSGSPSYGQPQNWPTGNRGMNSFGPQGPMPSQGFRNQGGGQMFDPSQRRSMNMPPGYPGNQYGDSQLSPNSQRFPVQSQGHGRMGQMGMGNQAYGQMPSQYNLANQMGYGQHPTQQYIQPPQSQQQQHHQSYMQQMPNQSVNSQDLSGSLDDLNCDSNSNSSTGPPPNAPTPTSSGAAGISPSLRPVQSPVGSSGSRSNTPASLPGNQAGSPMPPRPPSNQLDSQVRMSQSPMQTQGLNQQMMPPPMGPSQMNYVGNKMHSGGTMMGSQQMGPYSQQGQQFQQGNFPRSQNMQGNYGSPQNNYPNQMGSAPMYGGNMAVNRGMQNSGFGNNFPQGSGNMNMMNNQYGGYNNMGPSHNMPNSMSNSVGSMNSMPVNSGNSMGMQGPPAQGAHKIAREILLQAANSAVRPGAPGYMRPPQGLPPQQQQQGPRMAGPHGMNQYNSMNQMPGNSMNQMPYNNTDMGGEMPPSLGSGQSMSSTMPPSSSSIPSGAGTNNMTSSSNIASSMSSSSVSSGTGPSNNIQNTSMLSASVHASTSMAMATSSAISSLSNTGVNNSTDGGDSKAPVNNFSSGTSTSVTQSISQSISAPGPGPMANDTMSGDNSQDTVTSQTTETEEKPKPKNESVSHPPTPASIVAPSPGAGSMSSFHDDLENISSPSWPGTPVTLKNGKDSVLVALYDLGEEPERKTFLDKLNAFVEERGTPFTTAPTMNKQPLDLFKLYNAVKERGGVADVTKSKKWKEVCGALGVSANAGYTVRKHYLKFLLTFECRFDRGGIDPQSVITQIENCTQSKKRDRSAAAQVGNNMVRPPSVQSHNSMDNFSGMPHGGMGQMSEMNGPTGYHGHMGMPNAMGPPNTMGMLGPNGMGPNMPQNNMVPNMGHGGMMGGNQGGMMGNNAMMPNHTDSVKLSDPFSDEAMGPSQYPRSSMGMNTQVPPYSGSTMNMANSNTQMTPQSGMQTSMASSFNSRPSMGGSGGGPGFPMNQNSMVDNYPNEVPNLPAENQMQFQEGFPGNRGMQQQESYHSNQQGSMNQFGNQFENRFDQQRPMVPSQSMRPPQPPSMQQQQPPNQEQGQMFGNRFGSPMPRPTGPQQEQQQHFSGNQTFPNQRPFPSQDQFGGSGGYSNQGQQQQQQSVAPSSGFPAQQGPMQTPQKRFPGDMGRDGYNMPSGFGQQTPQQASQPPGYYESQLRNGPRPTPDMQFDNFAGGVGNGMYSFPPTPDHGPMTMSNDFTDHRSPGREQWGNRYGSVHPRGFGPAGMAQHLPPNQSPASMPTPMPYGSQTMPARMSPHRDARQYFQSGRMHKPGMQFPKKEVTFPPESVEAVTPVFAKRRKITAKDITPVDPWRLVMSLKSGLLAESTWALDTLTILLFDDSTVTYFGLNKLPGLVDVLLDHFFRCLVEVFGDQFEQLGYGKGDKCKISALKQDGNNSDDEHKDDSFVEESDEEKAYKAVIMDIEERKCESLTQPDNYTMLTRNGLKVKVEESSPENGALDKKLWDRYTRFPDTGSFLMGFRDISTHVQTHFEDGNAYNVLKEKFFTKKHIEVMEEVKKEKKVQTIQDEEKESEAPGEEDAKVKLEPSKPSHQDVITKNELETLDVKTENHVNCEKERANCEKSMVKKNDILPHIPNNIKKELLDIEDMESKRNEVKLENKESTMDDKTHEQNDKEAELLSESGDKQDDGEHSKPMAEKCNASESTVSFCRKRKLEDGVEEEPYVRDEPPLHLISDAQEELTRRCTCISNIFRSLACIPGNDTYLSKHTAFLTIMGKILTLHAENSVSHHQEGKDESKVNVTQSAEHESLSEDIVDETQGRDKWWWHCLEALRENTLVTFANIAGHLNLSKYPEECCRPVMEGFLYWAVNSSAYANDPMPTMSPNSVLSPKRLVLESLCKMCIHESNVDLLLATPPFSRLIKLFTGLVRLLSDTSEQVTREFALVLLSSLVRGDDSAARAIALQHPSISLLIDFVEKAEHNALQVANTQGINMLRDNPEMMGTSLDMLRRAAYTLLYLSRVPENRSLFLHHQERLLTLTMSQILDQHVAQILADVLYECSHVS